MALELLAGPFPVTLGSDLPATYWNTPMWLDDYGLIGLMRPVDVTKGRFRVAIAQLDGVAYTRHDGDFNHPNLFYDATTGELLEIATIGDKLYRFDPLTCARGKLVEDPWLPNADSRHVKLKDRYLRAISQPVNEPAIVQSSPHGGGGATWTTEYSPISGKPDGGAHITAYREGLLAIGWTDGKLNLYDPDRKQEVGHWRTIGMPNRGLWASARFGIFISLHDTNGRGSQQEIRIWADEVRPGSVSAPIALDPIRQARLSRVQVRVLGGDGEVAPDQLVDWEITAGPGQVIHGQSRTDADGYAEVDYRAPVTTTGDVTIRAGVSF